MKMTKLYWDKSTIDYYVEYFYLNGWAMTALRIYEYVADECEWKNETDMRHVFSDLLTQIQDKITDNLYK